MNPREEAKRFEREASLANADSYLSLDIAEMKHLNHFCYMALKRKGGNGRQWGVQLQAEVSKQLLFCMDRRFKSWDVQITHDSRWWLAEQLNHWLKREMKKWRKDHPDESTWLDDWMVMEKLVDKHRWLGTVWKYKAEDNSHRKIKGIIEQV